MDTIDRMLRRVQIGGWEYVGRVLYLQIEFLAVFRRTADKSMLLLPAEAADIADRLRDFDRRRPLEDQ